MFNDSQKILVLAPHTDDAEIGCGGAISKFTELGKEVFLANFSRAPVLKGVEPEIVLKEFKEASAILGVNQEHLLIYNYPTRTLCDHRQGILETMLEIKEKVKPDLVLMPTLQDIHQDHQTVAREGLRAFKHTTILGYEDPWNHLTFNTACFIHLTEQNVGKKIAAIKKYQSQKHRPYVQDKFIDSLARVRGLQAGMDFAEAFEVIRLIIK